MNKRYLVIDLRETPATPICNLGGYKSWEGADQARKGMSSPILRDGLDYVHHVLCVPPGNLFREELMRYVERNSTIVGVTKITYSCELGDTIELNIKEG